jgi:hypothetical protein
LYIFRSTVFCRWSEYVQKKSSGSKENILFRYKKFYQFKEMFMRVLNVHGFEKITGFKHTFTDSNELKKITRV